MSKNVVRLLLLSAMSLAASAWAELPDDVLTVSSNDLTAANYEWNGRASCSYGLVVQAGGHLGVGTGSMLIGARDFSDAVEGWAQDVRAEAAPPAVLPTMPTVATGTEAEWKMLFRLLKWSGVPSFLVNRGDYRLEVGRWAAIDEGSTALAWRDQGPGTFNPPQMQVYFRGGAFWGAAVTLPELKTHAAALVAAKGLKHLTLVLAPDEICAALQSPVLSRLESLSVEVRAPYQLSHRPERAPGRRDPPAPKTQPLANLGVVTHVAISENLKGLTSFTVDNPPVPRTFLGFREVLSLIGGSNLRHLDLRGVTVAWAAPSQGYPALANLESLRLRNATWDYHPPAPFDRHAVDALANWDAIFKSLGKGLQVLHVHQDSSRNQFTSTVLGQRIGTLLAGATQLSDLAVLVVQGLGLPADQVSAMAARAGKLRRFQFVETGTFRLAAAERMAMARAVRAVLDAAVDVEDAYLEWGFRVEEMPVLLDGLGARPLRRFALPVASFGIPGFQALANCRALRNVTHLDLHWASLSETGLDALGGAGAETRNVTHLRLGLHSPSTRGAAVGPVAQVSAPAQRAIDRLRARGVTVQIDGE